jgi:hypothetical protein
MAKKMVVTNDDWRILIEAKMGVNIHKKRHSKLNNLKATRKLKVLTNVEFKTKINVNNVQLGPHKSPSS